MKKGILIFASMVIGCVIGCLILTLGVLAFRNWMGHHNNVEIESEGRNEIIIISKADFPLNHTRMKLWFNRTSKKVTFITVKQGLEVYMDSDNDGLVDNIYIDVNPATLKSTWVWFEREESYEGMKKEFDEADKILREQKQRFKGLMQSAIEIARLKNGG